MLRNLVSTLIISLLILGNISRAEFTDNEEHRSTHFVVIPGLNGAGGDDAVDINSINPFSKNELTYIETPWLTPDLGQNQCIKYLDDKMKALQQNTEVKKIVIHASSQGTATALNYVAKNPNKVSAIILEAVLASGNSAVYHTVKNSVFPGFKNLPYSYYWMPYCAKAIFPFYSPGGAQAILLAEKIPSGIPIILIHSLEDQELPHSDALAIYHALKKSGNSNTYLITMKGQEHIMLLDKSTKEVALINTIFKKHNLPYSKNALQGFEKIELIKFQPSLYQTQPHFNDLVKKELILQKTIAPWMPTISISVISAVAAWYFGYF